MTICRKCRVNLILKGTILVIPFFLLCSCTSDSSKHKLRGRLTPKDGFTTILQAERDLPVVDQADVVVTGGGVAGVAAALSAAEQGLSVILIESRNYFGQELTATYQCRTTKQFPSPSLSLARAMCEELSKNGTLVEDRVDPLALRTYLLRKINEQPKIKVYLYSLASEVIHDGKRVRGLVFTGRDGKQVVLAKAVIDATEDARIAAAAGATFIRLYEGEKTARRFISLKRPAYLPVGTRPVQSGLGLSGDSIRVHEGFIEFAISSDIGSDVAADLSAIQASTLEKCFGLQDHLKNEGINLENLTPGPETWIDEMPVVSCRAKLNGEEIADVNFSNTAAIQPAGVEGLLITGRTVDSNPQMGSLQVLLGIGELAGRAAGTVANESKEFMASASATAVKKEDASGLRIVELLEGIEPGTDYPRIRQAATELPVLGEYDVVVVGGGTSGAFAAISAARHGSHTAVIEILPNLGGISTNRVNGYYWGIPWKSLLRQEVGDRIHLEKSTGGGPLEKVRFSGEDKKYALQDLAIQAGVTIYYQSLATGAVIENTTVRGVVVENASGRHVLMADVVIDATGHGGIAVAAGAGFDKGRDTDGFLHEIEHGPLRDPTHLGDISTSYLKFPSYSISMNIRESRRTSGDYMVTFDDVLHERLFPDNIIRWRCNYDTHFPTSANQSDLAQDWVAILGQWRKPIMGSIPYRSILPKGVDNIMVIGTAYSTDHDALIAARMQPDLEHLGEAAGLAAAMASRMNIPPRDVPVQQLQTELVRLGVLRNEDVPGRNISGGPSIEVLHRQDFWKPERDKQFPPADAGKVIPLEERVKHLGTDKSLEAMVQLYLAGEKSLPLLRPLLTAKGERAHGDVSPSDKSLDIWPLGTENRQVYEEAAVVAGLLGDRTAVPALMEFLKERNTRRFEFTLPLASSRPSLPLYWTSAILLGRFGEKEAVPELMDLLTNTPSVEELQMLNRSVYGIDMFETPDMTPPPLTSFLIVALGRIGDPKAADALRPLLSVSGQVPIAQENRDFETVWGIQTNAAWALAQMGDLSGVPMLIGLLDSDQALLRNYAQQLLEDITEEKLGRDSQVWEKWWKSRN